MDDPGVTMNTTNEGGEDRAPAVPLPLLMVLLLVVGLVVGGAASYLLWARQGDTGTAADEGAAATAPWTSRSRRRCTAR